MNFSFKRVICLIMLLAAGTSPGSPALAQFMQPISTNPLHWAAAKNDVPALRSLLANYPAEIDFTDGDTRSALHYAASNGAVDAAAFLIAHRANLNIATHRKGSDIGANVTPLSWAIEYGHHDVARKLIAAHCDVNLVRTDSHQSPLWQACGKDDVSLIYALLDAGADPKYQNPDKWTCLNWFCYHQEDPGVVKAFILHGVDPTLRNYYGNTALCSAMSQGHPGDAKALLDNGAGVDEQGEIEPSEKKCSLTATAYAAQRHSDCLRLALAYGGDPTVKDGLGRDCLQIAIEANKMDCQEILREYLPLKAQGWTAAHYAAHVGMNDAFVYLQAHSKSLDAKANDGRTPLMVACESNNPGTVLKLLELHCQVNARDAKNETALHKAIRQNNEVVARMLVAAECDTTIRNKQGETAADIAHRMGMPELERALQAASISGASPTLLRKFLSNRDSVSIQALLKKSPALTTHRYSKEWTPLHFAAFEGDTASATVLLDSGAWIEARNENGSTPLMIAVQEGKTALVKQLLARKASVAAKDKQGWTPLHIAAQEDRAEIARDLLRAGAGKSAKDNKGRTPRDVALKLGHTDLAKILN